MLTVNFHEVAAALIARGFAVIPLLPGQKDPDTNLVGKIDGVSGTGGATRRTRDLATIALWSQASPNANVGVCSDDEITILESDNESAFRQLVRDVSRTMFGAARELPQTLTSRARENRPHFFFRTTPKTRATEGSPAIQGLFEWRRENQYVVGPGSLHPTGVKYQVVVEAPIAPMPDWLVDVLLEIRRAYRGEGSSVSKFVRVGPAAVCRDALLSAYALDPEAMLADESFELTVEIGERHYFLQSMAGLLHDGTRTEEELLDVLKRLRDKYCTSGKGDYEVENLAHWTIGRTPSDVEPNLPAMIKGTTVYRDQAEYDAAGNELKSVADIQWQKERVEGKRCEYVLLPLEGSRFSGWFPQGRPSIIAGASGSGKSTLMLDLLHRQSSGGYAFGHRGAGLRYLVLFADRGHLANEETLDRLGLLDKDIPIDYLPIALDDKAVAAILSKIEDQALLPQAVFIEGGDMLVSKPNDAEVVARFMRFLQEIASFYHIAIILSLGAPKSNKQTGPTARRDFVFGSQMWSRVSDTIAVLSSDDDGTGDSRKLTIQHRNAATEEFALRFQSGHLVEVPKALEAESDPVEAWLATQSGEFKAADGLTALKDEGACNKSTFYRRINELIKRGKLAQRFDETGKRLLKKVEIVQ